MSTIVNSFFDHKESTNTNINNLSMKALAQGWALAMLMAKTPWSVLRRATETMFQNLITLADTVPDMST